MYCISACIPLPLKDKDLTIRWMPSLKWFPETTWPILTVLNTWYFITELPVLLRIPFHHVCIFYSTSHICSFSCVMVSILLCRSNLTTQCFWLRVSVDSSVDEWFSHQNWKGTQAPQAWWKTSQWWMVQKKEDNITEAFADLIIKSAGVLLVAKSKSKNDANYIELIQQLTVYLKFY